MTISIIRTGKVILAVNEVASSITTCESELDRILVFKFENKTDDDPIKYRASVEFKPSALFIYDSSMKIAIQHFENTMKAKVSRWYITYHTRRLDLNIRFTLEKEI